MIYPKFIEKNATIGVCAPSAGVGKKLDIYTQSLDFLKQEGYKIKETASVRKNNDRSAGAKTRAKEIDELVTDKDVDMIVYATGGDYMIEVMPYIDFEHIKENPKWMMGYSDPTNILFPVTCRYDIATLYGFNAGSYEFKNPRFQKENLSIVSGKMAKQKSHSHFMRYADYEAGTKHPVKWVAKKDMTIEGRLIGGCFEAIEKLIGTPYDYVSDFIERHKDDGIVWYFDVFAESSYNFYLALLQMKYAGYFRHCKGVLIGRVAFPNVDNPKFDYLKAADKALGNIPHIMEMDIGHVDPRMTMINGAMVKANYHDGKGGISFRLE